MKSYTVQANPSKDDDSWHFVVPPDAFSIKARADILFGKSLKFTPQAITFQMERLPNNRILSDDDPSKFILVSFTELRFPDSSLRDTTDYIKRLMKAGVFLNDVQYRFYHHSNSQLRGRSCFLREANTDAELDARIYRFGDFGKIMNVAKRAKRIGLLFSAAEVDYDLPHHLTADIPDLKSGDETFSDGCGLISKRLAIQVSRAKRIIFRDKRYTPCVFQIRYLGYKGVLMLHPQMDVEKKHLAEFRHSMRKFSAATKSTFSVVDYSKPYAFGRLNNDIIVLLSSLGITNERLLQKQAEYHEWISAASQDVTKAIDFLSCLGQYSLAERVLLDGLDDPAVSRAVRKSQIAEVTSFRKDGKLRERMMIRKSRLIFGVCDPYKVLREGEVFIRISVGRRGETTPIHGDVLVVRNPCLHPGDCLKLRAVHHKSLSHLVDCIVFAAVAKPGHHSAPAMSSGGDLDGDKYFVCWDPDLMPTQIAESYDYPPNKEHVSKDVTRADLANHFASYNNSGLAKVASLHGKWARWSPDRALSSQCQELNALHSQSVDGARIKIPDRLLTPPEATEPYIIDVLTAAASEFAARFNISSETWANVTMEREGTNELILHLLHSNQSALSEYELFNLSFGLARKHSIDFRPYLVHLDVGAMSTAEKYALTASLHLPQEYDPYLWNSLVRSDLLTAHDLYQKRLDRPYALQRLYSSNIHGLSTFFEYLRMATQEFTRKLLILKTDERFAVGIFMRGDIPWDEEPDVAENVVVCPFMSQSSLKLPTFRPCPKGYRLHVSDGNFQLYNEDKRNTFVFMSRPRGTEVATSIALQKISRTVQKQIGRIYRTPVTAIELHVISNRDRVAHQLFDLWFEHIPTENFIKRSAREITSYERNNLKDVAWEELPEWLKAFFVPKQSTEAAEQMLSSKTPQQLDLIMDIALGYHAEDELFWAFRALLRHIPLRRENIIKHIEREPQLVFALLKVFPPDDSCNLHAEISALDRYIIIAIVRTANRLGIATLVALEKIRASIAQIPMELYIEILFLASLSVRASQLVQEVLLVLNECRAEAISYSDALRYAHKHALAVAFDRAEEAADECPCDEEGKPKRQRTAPAVVQLSAVADKPNHVKASVRIDLRTQVRLYSHIRLQAASTTEKEWTVAPILDGIVIQALKGEMKIELLHTPPPEMSRMDWKMYNAGSIATSKAMMDAIVRLVEEGNSCCGFYNLITSTPCNTATTPEALDTGEELALDEDDHLNPSQLEAVRSCEAPLSLIWGPPGTGKTETVVRILGQILQASAGDIKILVTASTHNAVDNVLERFVAFNKRKSLLQDEQILRVATDHSKVNKSLQSYTIDARVGGDMNDNSRLVKQAQQRVNAAVLIFTTCAGSGLGILRKEDFSVVLIDEASQITEPCALIPLVKGCQRAILVGDHVQLRPTVRKMAKALEYDVSLLERLYNGAHWPEMRRTMLNVQYRFPKELAAFPSQEFYKGKLQTGIQNSEQVLSVLKPSDFPWPEVNGVVVPTVFIQCSTEEDMGGQSKSNAGQAELVSRIIPMLTKRGTEPNDSAKSLKITVLSPYNKQVKALQHLLPSSVSCSTVDSFQGRESDIIIFSTVRCNSSGDIGFVEDERRLNVMWTRAKLALIIVGDRKTMTTSLSQGSERWKRAIDSCSEVKIELPSS